MTPAEANEPVARREILQVQTHLQELIKANDERYEQRFLDSQTAVQAALSAARTAVDAALSAAKEAVAKAEAASEKRFEGVNEFRATLSDQQRTVMPRSEQESINKSIMEKLGSHEQRFDRLTGQRTGVRDVWGYVVAIAGLTIAALAVIFHKP